MPSQGRQTPRLQQSCLLEQPVHGNPFSRPRLRFFSLTRFHIEWYTDESSFDEGKGCLGHLPVAGATAYFPAGSLVFISAEFEKPVLFGENLDSWNVSLQRAIAPARLHGEPGSASGKR